MTKAAVKERVQALEAEVRLLKTAVSERPDFSIDDKNWQKVKPASKKVRAKLYMTCYVI